jgi:phage-related minor tail protein
MAKYKNVLEDVYTGNFGESQEEVANVLALIKQTTNETNPSKLKDMTENLFTLRDTYDYDFVETLRAVNMLMEQFGVTGDEAFNLIAQGSQKGLNKNGDLLDTINEYSVHYKQLGYDANEFFNSLENGSKAGTFSIDKLGDAMKEFGIRSKDTASSTQEGFALLGYGAKARLRTFKKPRTKSQSSKKIFTMQKRSKKALMIQRVN